MGHVVPTMPTPPRPRRTVACCEYCRREIRGLADSCAGCGAPITAEANVGADFDLIECTTLGDAERRFAANRAAIEAEICYSKFVTAGLMTRDEVRAVLR